MKRVLSTHAGGRLGLGMTRGLKAAPEDIYVVAADGGKHDLHRAHGDEKVQIPLANSPSYLPFIKDGIREKNIDFLWPAHDGEIAVVSADEELRNFTFLPPAEMVRTCHSKTLTHEKLVAAGVPAPRSMPIATENDLANAFEQLGVDI